MRVLVIGADPSGEGWGGRAHVPAVLAHPDLELVAVCTARPETAARAAMRWRVPRAYSDFQQAVADPDVDLVTIAVRVPLHAAVARAAIAAGKSIYCEWPLARTSGEAAALAAEARASGVRAAVGLQARFSPAVRRAREALAGGELGRPLSYTAVQALSSFAVPSDRAWLARDEDGSGALHVATGHVLDLVEYLLAPVTHVAGACATVASEDAYSDTGEPFRWSAADTVAATALLADGTLGTIFVTYRADPPGGFSLRVFCEDGTLEVVAPGYVSFTPGTVRVAHKAGPQLARVPPLPTPVDGLELDESSPGSNVARALGELAAARREGRRFEPAFDDAVRLHALLEKISGAREGRGECGRQRRRGGRVE